MGINSAISEEKKFGRHSVWYRIGKTVRIRTKKLDPEIPPELYDKIIHRTKRETCESSRGDIVLVYEVEGWREED